MRGRPKKNLNLSSASIEPGEFELPRFSSVLNQIGGDASKWSLKKEWIVFHKTYYNTSKARPKQARACYYFYRLHVAGSLTIPGQGENSKRALHFVDTTLRPGNQQNITVDTNESSINAVTYTPTPTKEGFSLNIQHSGDNKKIQVLCSSPNVPNDLLSHP